MNSDRARERSRRRASSRAAPTSIAVCASWPHACIAPSTSEANGKPGLLRHRQRVHVGPQQDRRAGPRAARAAPRPTSCAAPSGRRARGRRAPRARRPASAAGTSRARAGGECGVEARWCRPGCSRASSRIAMGFMKWKYRVVYGPEEEETVMMALALSARIDDPARPDPRAAGSPRGRRFPEGQITFAVHVSLAPSWFDPAETPGVITPFLTLYALHDALVKPMPGNAWAPSLAESWTASKDGLTLRVRPPQGRAVPQRRSGHRRGREVLLRALQGRGGHDA